MAGERASRLVRQAPARLSPAQDQLRGRVRAYLDAARAAARFVPSCDAWLTGWDEEFSRSLAAQGWVGMLIPSPYGGAGASTLDRHVVLEELLAAGAPVAAHWVAERQVVPALLHHGTEEQRQRFLPKIAAGRCTFAVAMSEPDAGSDLTALRTAATPADGGWTLSGTKVWTSGAHHAEVISVLARTPDDPETRPRSSYTQFLVPTSSAGLTVRPIVTLDGLHHFNEVVLESVFVPKVMVLGSVGRAWQQVRAELAYERGGPERFLSVFPLVRAVVNARRERGAEPAPDEQERIGLLIARLAVLRQMSLALAGSVDASGAAPGAYAALVKDLGTSLETEAVELARRLIVGRDADVPSLAPLRVLLREAVTRLPGFGIRAGTVEMLRDLVARELGFR